MASAPVALIRFSPQRHGFPPQASVVQFLTRSHVCERVAVRVAVRVGARKGSEHSMGQRIARSLAASVVVDFVFLDVALVFVHSLARVRAAANMETCPTTSGGNGILRIQTIGVDIGDGTLVPVGLRNMKPTVRGTT